DLAPAIGPGLAKAAVAARVDGQVWDLTRRLPDGVTVAILTERDRQALDVLRHSSAHVLATAVRQLFPHAKIGFGPPIEDGFYYDFEVPTPFTPEDLERIEAKMHEVVRADYPFVREEVDRAEAKRRFADDPLKLERIEDVILERGYQLVYTPNLTREELFLRSGHLPLYAANQFPPMAAGEGEGEGVHYRVKPMNCPMHILIYAAQQRSYRDLPIRLAE